MPVYNATGLTRTVREKTPATLMQCDPCEVGGATGCEIQKSEALKTSKSG